MHAQASFWCTLGSPKAPKESRPRLPSMYQHAMIILLSVQQQTREHNYTATYPHVDRPVTALCSGSSCRDTCTAETPAQHHV